MSTTRTAAVISAAVMFATALAGCASADPPASAPAPTSTSAASTSAASTSVAAWSSEAVAACRQFINGVPQLSIANDDDTRYRPGMTPAQLSLAVTGWGLLTANMTIPANNAMTAEPEVHDALAAVVDAAANLQPVRNGGGGPVLDNGESYGGNVRRVR